jgi:hypothetical protein
MDHMGSGTVVWAGPVYLLITEILKKLMCEFGHCTVLNLFNLKRSFSPVILVA